MRFKIVVKLMMSKKKENKDNLDLIKANSNNKFHRN